MFPSSITQQYIGMHISELEIYVGDIVDQFKLKIYAEGTKIEPGKLLYEQIFTPTADMLNTITLDNNFILNGEGIWMSIEFTQSATGYPIGVDQPGSANKNGQWVKMDGEDWMTLWNIDNWTENFIIRGKLEGESFTNWLTFNQNGGTVLPNSSETVIITVNTQNINEGIYQASINVLSNYNYPDYNYTPVTLNVGGVGIDSRNIQASKFSVYPNPFSESTVLNFGLTENSEVKIEIINIYGQVVDILYCGHKIKGKHNVKWGNNSIENGIYYCKFYTDSSIEKTIPIIKNK